jgi:sec-independent protein translocase protein TatB
MFDIGFSELLVIAVVALLVLGPERLPKAARFAGLWVRKARAQWYSVKSEFERDLAADELQRSLKETRESLRQAEEQLRGGADSIRQQFEKNVDEIAAAATAPLAMPDGEQASPDDAAASQRRVQQDEEENRPMGSSLEMDDLEPPPPTDEDDDEVQDGPDHSPQHPADDAHAGR